MIGIGLVGVAAVAAATKFMGMAAKLEQMETKATTVFGDQKGLVESWAKTNAAAMGLTSRQAVGLSADFADLLIPMGFTRKSAAEMSTKVVGLSGALSQWSAGQYDASQVADILAKAMLGEREGLKALGISISEADVKAQLLADGTDKLTGNALQQAKAQATQTLIFAKSTDAQAAFAKGGDTLLGKQAVLGAKFSEVTESIAAGLTPALSGVMSFITDTAVPAVESVIGQIKAWFEANQELVNEIRNQVEGVLKKFIEVVVGIVTEIAKFIQSIIDNKGIMKTFGDAFKTVSELIGMSVGVLEKFVGFIFAVVSAMTSNKPVMDAFGATFEFIGDVIGVAVEALKTMYTVAGGALDFLSGLFAPQKSSYDSMRGFAHGGWAGLNGPEAIVVGEQGPEFIVPNGGTAPGGMGGGGVAIQGVTERELMDMVDRGLYFRLRRTAT